jgi:hypothetical protein
MSAKVVRIPLHMSPPHCPQGPDCLMAVLPEDVRILRGCIVQRHGVLPYMLADPVAFGVEVWGRSTIYDVDRSAAISRVDAEVFQVFHDAGVVPECEAMLDVAAPGETVLVQGIQRLCGGHLKGCVIVVRPDRAGAAAHLAGDFAVVLECDAEAGPDEDRWSDTPDTYLALNMYSGFTIRSSLQEGQRVCLDMSVPQSCQGLMVMVHRGTTTGWVPWGRTTPLCDVETNCLAPTAVGHVFRVLDLPPREPSRAYFVTAPEEPSDSVRARTHQLEGSPWLCARMHGVVVHARSR